MACSGREDDLIIRPSEPSLSRRRMLLAPIGTVRPKTVDAPHILSFVSSVVYAALGAFHSFVHS